MAEKANVTKRTIDHYSNLGLLQAERSASNYRYYDASSIMRINFIEQCKMDGLSLCEIKKKLLEKDSEEMTIIDLKAKMKDLEKDVSDVLSHLDHRDRKKKEYIEKNISNESLSLIQTLLLLLH